jgi:hypothetical protein
MHYSPPFFITQTGLVIQSVKTVFSSISGISERICRLAKIRSSLVANNARRVFLSDSQRGRSQLVLGLSNEVDAAFFGLLWIQSFLKRVTTCELAHCEDAIEYPSVFFCDSMSRYFVEYPK